MILSGQSIEKAMIISPFAQRTEFSEAFYGKMTYGCGPAGYDVRVEFDAEGNETYKSIPEGKFLLASTVEYFRMPNNILGVVHDKSSLARRGLSVQNTVIEPGWEGFLTLEITNHSNKTNYLARGMPIAQVVFHVLDEPAANPYRGKYQMQRRGPQEAL